MQRLTRFSDRVQIRAMASQTRRRRSRVVNRVIKAAGGVNALAQGLGISPPAISFWDRGVPVRRVIAVERLTGISRYELRPDIYPIEGA
jgi:DNA-binding transcriptional regulator YdaS (Cro superfamily)